MSCLRNHLSLAVLGVMLAVTVSAQPGELTDEFGKLNAKERARIARQEEENAAKDAVFQGLMAEAEERFRTTDFDGALAKYQEARALRPYNVYPKVKIQDLQALIARRDAGKHQEPVPMTTEPSPVTEATLVPPVDEAPVIRPEVKSGAMPSAPEPSFEPATVRSVPPIDTRTEQPVRGQSVVRSMEPGPRLEEGERVYKEGRSVVVETATAEDGRIVLYRKVSHPWGEDHFFRDGLPISDRAYKTALGR